MDYISNDLEGAAHYAALADDGDNGEAFARRRPSRSGTASCRGCSDPTCGFCEDYEESEDDYL